MKIKIQGGESILVYGHYVHKYIGLFSCKLAFQIESWNIRLQTEKQTLIGLPLHFKKEGELEEKEEDNL